ncbi:MAG: flavin reductase family protein, partial [Alphaproteobacteria bacterium]|nr:flavin reductase family protein [Alphaproteobacteria bacterium]
VAVEPSLLGFSVGPSPEREKDTLRNIRRTGEFVINTVPERLAAEVQACAETFGPEESEAEATGLQVISSTRVRPPRLLATQIQFECRLHSITAFGASHLVVGRVLVMHAEKGLVSECKIDASAYRPLGRIGGRSYCRMGEIFSV